MSTVTWHLALSTKRMRVSSWTCVVLVSSGGTEEMCLWSGHQNYSHIVSCLLKTASGGRTLPSAASHCHNKSSNVLLHALVRSVDMGMYFPFGTHLCRPLALSRQTTASSVLLKCARSVMPLMIMMSSTCGWGHHHRHVVQYTAHAVVLTNILSQPLRQNVLFSPYCQ